MIRRHILGSPACNRLAQPPSASHSLPCVSQGDYPMTRTRTIHATTRAYWFVLVLLLIGSALFAGRASALTLSPTQVTVAAGSSVAVKISNASGQIQAESKNTAVVKVALSNVTTTSATLSVSGISAGSATVYVRDARTSNVSLPVTVVKSTTATTAWVYKVLATNDLGMHCVDADFSVFSILPPYNVLNAQVVRRSSTGKPVLMNDSTVSLRYQAVRDAAGSINSSSLNSALGRKTNFWTYAEPLYGAKLLPGQGLKGLYMPADTTSRANTSLAWTTSGNL